ncbi:efflux RND transporter periplasmic adaptor subunit [Rubinisphaera brasiliensis]|uniref:Efflux transporter, RND family, MFP subunit n=1 Tax=Rubinisphaera brasiliensis (strain ATCC 49424 / DSM 5305 / JCM 21570 / IAM 15109 / NBRC 103401 / IFAM 1448) TaxID=756272 RepID=F0SIS1_RUBBR|nr:efflux RND transporter periplasmic adaptor subunit [Rubinisphaera brasiliensis]ADY60745.1 efflux transporter, RND family, MFP subunit [Rubinisphaera brasiliensis DSM 5305]
MTVLPPHWSTIFTGVKPAVLILGLLLVVISGCEEATTSSPYSSRTSVAPLQVETVSLEPVDSTVVDHEYFGQVQPVRSVNLGFSTSGLLTTLSVEAGQDVQAGAVLGRLQARSLEETQQALQNAVEESRASLQRIGEGDSEMERIETRRQIDELWMQLNTVRDSATFPESTETTANKRRFDELESRIRDLDGQSRAQMNASRDQKRNEALAQIRDFEKQLRDIEAQLQQTRLTAPFSGQVTEVYQQPGNTVRAGEAVLQLQDRSSLRVYAHISRELAGQLSKGAAVPLRINGEELEGTIESIDPPTTAAPALQRIIIRLPSSDQESGVELIPGQIATIKLQQQQTVDGYWVPKSAVIREIESSWSIYIVESRDGERFVQRRYVDVILNDDDRILISGDLQNDDLVVANGVTRIVPGQKVTLVDSAADKDVAQEGEGLSE